MYRPFYSPKKVINPQPNDTPPTVKPALLGSAVDYFGLGLVTPLLPFFCTEFAGSVDSVGYVLSAQYLGVIFGSAAVGYLSDRIGRKNTLMIALAGDVIFFSLTGFVKTVPTMCVVRLFAGLFTPLAACIAWVQDAAGNDELARAKNQGYFGGSAVIGFMSGAAAGGILGYSSFTAMNCVCGAFALFALVYTFFSLEPTRPHSEQKTAGIENIVKNKYFFSLAFSNFVVGCQFTAITTLFSIVMMEQFGYVEYQVSLCLISTTFFHLVIMVNLARLMKIFKTGTNLIVMSYVAAVISHVGFLFDPAYHTDLITASLFMFATLCLPLGMSCANVIAPNIADVFGTNARGSTLGILRTVFNIGQALGPSYGVILYKAGGWGGEGILANGGLFFAIQACMLLLSCGCLLRTWGFEKNEVIKKKHQKEIEIEIEV